MAQASRDQNFVPTLLGVSNADGTTPVAVYADPTTHRLLVDLPSGSGTVTSVSVVSANGFAGTVATATTTPAITLTTSINSPILAGNGTAISAATTTGSGSTAVLATAPVFPTTITVGAAAGATGDILLKGTTSGTVTVTTADAAGTWTFQLPATDGDAGQFLRTDGTGITTWETVTAGAGGSNTQVQYNNAGALAGITGATTNGTALTLVAPILGTPASGTLTNCTGLPTLLVADEATDTTCFINFTTAASGELGIKTNTNLTFNSNTGVLTSASSVLTTTDINGGTIDGVTIGGASAGAITGTTITANTGFLPDTDGGAYLGQPTQAFSNLYLDTTATINFDNGNAVLTHSSGILTVSTGDLRVTTAGTNSASAVTVGGTQTLTSKTLTSPTIGGTALFSEGGAIAYDAASSADGVYTGFVRAGTAGATLAFGDLVYLSSVDSRWELADSDAASTSDRFLGMCVLAAAADGDPTTILLTGFIRADAAFPAMTIGSAMYVGETAGDIQVAIPTGADNVIRRVGYAWTADELYFNPSMDSQVTVA